MKWISESCDKKMNKTKVLATVIDVARADLCLTPADAISYIADLIGREDAGSVSYDANVEMLLRVGACIWTLRYALLARGPKKGRPTGKLEQVAV